MRLKRYIDAMIVRSIRRYLDTVYRDGRHLSEALPGVLKIREDIKHFIANYKELRHDVKRPLVRVFDNLSELVDFMNGFRRDPILIHCTGFPARRKNEVLWRTVLPSLNRFLEIMRGSLNIMMMNEDAFRKGGAHGIYDHVTGLIVDVMKKANEVYAAVHVTAVNGKNDPEIDKFIAESDKAIEQVRS